jgi:hypothetical protein
MYFFCILCFRYYSYILILKLNFSYTLDIVLLVTRFTLVSFLSTQFNQFFYMKTILYLCLLLFCATVAKSQAPPRVNINGVWYTQDQTAYIPCNLDHVFVYIDPWIYATSPTTGDVVPIKTITSNNFSVSETDAKTMVRLNLNPNRTNGWIQIGYKIEDPTYFNVNIVQALPTPLVSNLTTLCSSGQTTSPTAQISYNFQNSLPANIVWQGAGGVTINGNSQFVQTNTTSSNVNINYSSSGSLVVYTQVPGCNNLQSPPSPNFEFGTPIINQVSINNSPNSGPYASSSGSLNFVSVRSAFDHAPTYSFSTNTNFGDINLSVWGMNGGNCQVYVSGSYGNAALNITASNTCGSTSASTIFYIPSSYRMAPNPARNTLTVSFSNTEDEYALPDELELISEKNGSSKLKVNVTEIFKKKAFKNGKDLPLDVSELERGTYYLRVRNSRQSAEKGLRRQG